ncbi:MAG: hypothetical protein ABIP74_03430 [Candidatus Saccharimonas sp.]
MNPFDFWSAARALIEGNYGDLFAQLAAALTSSAIPPLAIFKLAWFNTQLGASVGLAIALFTPITLVVGLVLMVKVPAARQTPMTGRLFTSVWLLALFIAGFYPLSAMIITIIAAIRDGGVILVTGLQTPDLGPSFKIITSMLPTDISLQLGAKVVFAILSFVLMFEVSALMIATPFMIFLYPIFIMLRVFGGILDKIFHTLTTWILIGVLAPPLMAVVMLVPVAVSKFPGIGNAIWIQFVAGVLAFGFAIYLPFFIRKKSKDRLNEVFGRIDAFGKINADVRGSVTTRSLSSSGGPSGNQPSPAGAFAKSMAIGTAAVGLSSKNGDEFRKKVRHVAADAAAAGLAAGGLPGAAAIVQAVDTTAKVHEENAKRKEIARDVAITTAQAMSANQSVPPPSTPPPSAPPTQPPSPSKP